MFFQIQMLLSYKVYQPYFGNMDYGSIPLSPCKPGWNLYSIQRHLLNIHLFWIFYAWLIIITLNYIILFYMQLLFQLILRKTWWKSLAAVAALLNLLVIIAIVFDPLKIVRRGPWVTILNLATADLFTCISAFCLWELHFSTKLKAFCTMWFFILAGHLAFPLSVPIGNILHCASFPTHQISR
jgi:hypothetical protein